MIHIIVGRVAFIIGLRFATGNNALDSVLLLVNVGYPSIEYRYLRLPDISVRKYRYCHTIHTYNYYIGLISIRLNVFPDNRNSFPQNFVFWSCWTLSSEVCNVATYIFTCLWWLWILFFSHAIWHFISGRCLILIPFHWLG